jgi:hypothetical protein
MVQVPSKIQSKLSEVISELVAGHYQQLESVGVLRPNTAQGTQNTIEAGPGKITMPPPSAFEDIRELMEYPSNLEGDRSWMVVFDLWFDNKPTFCVLEATYIEKANGEVTFIVEQIV